MVKDILFLSGSYESQRIACLDNPNICLFDEIRKHFIFSCLLADSVIQPIGHFYQSEIIQRITKEFEALFFPNTLNEGRPMALYAINMFKDSFKEDADEKSNTFLGSNFKCYHDDDYKNQLTEESSIFSSYRRQGKQLDTLADYTLKECSEGGSLYGKLFTKLNDDQEVKRALRPLISAVTIKEYAILPEYIDYLDTNKSLKNYMTLTRIILMEAYDKSCAQLYNTAYINNPIKRFYPVFYEQNYQCEINYLDTNIFDIFITSVLPEIKTAILRMNSEKLIKLKRSANFIRFKEFYIEFIEQLKITLRCCTISIVSPEDRIRMESIHEYATQKKQYQEKVRSVLDDNASVLYNALKYSIGRHKSNIRKKFTKDYFEYGEFPIIAFSSEVLEEVVGIYEKFLFEYYTIKREITEINNTVNIKYLNQIKTLPETSKWIRNSEQLFIDTIDKREEKVAAAIEKVHTNETVANHTNKEDSLRYVIKTAYCTYKDHYLEFQELPSGHGYADIVYIPLSDCDWPVLIIELKWNKSAKTAIDQIIDREYPSALKNYKGKILLVGISYNKKAAPGERRHTCKIIEYIKDDI